MLVAIFYIKAIFQNNAGTGLFDGSLCFSDLFPYLYRWRLFSLYCPIWPSAALVAYIALGAFMGPYGMGWVTDVDLIAQIATMGIIFLLFLLGLDMQPQALLRVLREVTHITLI